VSSRLRFVLTLLPLLAVQRIAIKATAAMMTREVRSVEVFDIFLANGLPWWSDTMEW
jgi:hypothetical protein